MTADGKHGLVVWTIQGDEVWTLRGHSGRVSSVAYHPDGQRIVSGSVEDGPCPAAGGAGSVRLWDALSGQELLMLHGPGQHVAFREEGDKVMAWDDHGRVKVWSSSGGLQPTNRPAIRTSSPRTSVSQATRNATTVYRPQAAAEEIITQASWAIPDDAANR